MYRAWLRHASSLRALRPRPQPRFASQNAPNSPTPQQPQVAYSKTRARLDSWIAWSPKWFKPTLRSLRDAPASYVVSFLVLHEITAVLPLFGLAGAFHYFRWLPPYFAEGQWVIEGVQRLGRYARRKGWMSEEETLEAESETRQGRAGSFEKGGISQSWSKGDVAGRWLVEFATAYAVVKALLPLRIMFSVWAAPVFARWTLLPIRNAVGGLWSRRSMR